MARHWQAPRRSFPAAAQGLAWSLAHSNAPHVPTYDVNVSKGIFSAFVPERSQAPRGVGSGIHGVTSRQREDRLPSPPSPGRVRFPRQNLWPSSPLSTQGTAEMAASDAPGSPEVLRVWKHLETERAWLWSYLPDLAQTVPLHREQHAVYLFTDVGSRGL